MLAVDYKTVISCSNALIDKFRSVCGIGKRRPWHLPMMPMVHLWIICNQNLLYVGREISVAIKANHGFLESISNASKRSCIGKCINQLTHELINDEIEHY